MNNGENIAVIYAHGGFDSVKEFVKTLINTLELGK